MARFVESEGGVISAVPGESPDLSPVVHLGYNTEDDMVAIRKFVGGKTFERDVYDPDIANQVVDRWIEYRVWTEL